VLDARRSPSQRQVRSFRVAQNWARQGDFGLTYAMATSRQLTLERDLPTRIIAVVDRGPAGFQNSYIRTARWMTGTIFFSLSAASASALRPCFPRPRRPIKCTPTPGSTGTPQKQTNRRNEPMYSRRSTDEFQLTERKPTKQTQQTARKRKVKGARHV
jgi:hypothetical protein